MKWYIERKIENKRKNHFRNEDSQNRSITKVNKHNEKMPQGIDEKNEMF